MFRIRTLYALGAAIVAAAAAAAGLGWWQSGPVGPPDDGKERTPAERIVGTWVQTGYDHYKAYWWQSSRFLFHADGTWSMRTNYKWRLFRTDAGGGTYELVGNEIRITGREFEDVQDCIAAGLGPESVNRLTTRVGQVAVLTRDDLTLLAPQGSDPPRRMHYRRVR